MEESIKNLEYSISVREDPSTHNLVFEMERKIEGIPFRVVYQITREHLKLNDEDFCRVNKILNTVLRRLSNSLSEYIQRKLSDSKGAK